MEVRHAFQGAMRATALSYTSSAATLFAPRHTSLVSAMRRHQSTAAAAKPPPAPAAAEQDASPKPARAAAASPPPAAPSAAPLWARPKSLDPSAAPSAAARTSIGGRAEFSLMDRLNLPREGGGPTSSPLGSMMSKSLLGRGAAGAYFDVNDFMGKAEERERRRLVPSLGREVPVNDNVDPARAFALLSMSISRNKVPRDVRLQRFHERPGLKRKRLKMERWRARFKYSFRNTVNRVRDLAKQGW